MKMLKSIFQNSGLDLDGKHASDGARVVTGDHNLDDPEQFAVGVRQSSRTRSRAAATMGNTQPFLHLFQAFANGVGPAFMRYK
jgi:hypothetical protein